MGQGLIKVKQKQNLCCKDEKRLIYKKRKQIIQLSFVIYQYQQTIETMISYRQFLEQKITYLVSHFHKNCVLMDFNGTQLSQINLSFDSLSDQYLNFCQQQQKKRETQQQIPASIESRPQAISQMHSLNINQNDLNIKLNDKNLTQFWQALLPSYELGFNIENQSITDQSILQMAQLISNNMCRFTKLRLGGNTKITQVGILKLGQSLRNKDFIKQINLHGLQIGANGINRVIELIGVTSVSSLDLGLIGNESLKYLAKHLENPHHLDSIWFGESLTDNWQQDGKQAFQTIVRKSQYSKRIIAINLYPTQPIKHYSLISQLNIITKKNRSMRIDQSQNQFKAASLNPNHASYYDPDNHNLNAYKFSVKSYLTNVFGSLLDEALYFLQKERRNQLRDEATFEITNEPTNKVILEDICTSDGSIIVLTKYLLAKIKEKENQEIAASS